MKENFRWVLVERVSRIRLPAWGGAGVSIGGSERVWGRCRCSLG